MVTPLGRGVETTWRRLIGGDCGIRGLTHDDLKMNSFDDETKSYTIDQLSSKVASFVTHGTNPGEFDEGLWLNSKMQRSLWMVFPLVSTDAFYPLEASSSRSCSRKTRRVPRLRNQITILKEVLPYGAVGYEAFVYFLSYIYTGGLKPFPLEVSTCVDSVCAHDSCRPAIDFVVELMYASSILQVPELVSSFQRRLCNFVEK
ncbi:hypothetical protein Bca4012_038983 [Brassica carinata]